MTLEPSYTENELRRVGAAIHLSGYLDRVITLSTPDTRLQALVDAWNGMTTEQQATIGEVCGGYEDDAAVDVLLDALTEGEDDE